MASTVNDDDMQMQPLDLSCPRRRSSYDVDVDSDEPTNLVMTPSSHITTTTIGDFGDRPHSAESDSDSERPRNFTKSALRLSSGSENGGPARKRFLTKYLHKDTSGRFLKPSIKKLSSKVYSSLVVKCFLCMRLR
jgi:hypothetical protein